MVARDRHHRFEDAANGRPGTAGEIAAESQTIAVIVVTAQGTIDSAVQAMRMGAYDSLPSFH